MLAKVRSWFSAWRLSMRAREPPKLPPERASRSSLTRAPVPMAKMVVFWTVLILASILSSVSFENVSRPEPMRMMYLRPSMRLVRSSVS